MKTSMSVLSVACAAMTLLTGCGADRRYARTDNGVVVTPDSGAAKRVRLQVLSDRVVRVTAVPTEHIDTAASLMVTAVPVGTKFTVEDADNVVTLKTAQVTASVALDTGAVSFKDAQAKPVLSESQRAFTPVKLDGKNYYAIQQQFNPNTAEAFYGLGQHQNAQMNYNGEDVELAQHNMDVAVPLVLSSNGYGLLWDNNSITRFGNPKPYGLVSRDMKVYDAADKLGGFTANYYIDGKLKVSRVEADINYQYARDLLARPSAMLGTTVSNTTAQQVDVKGETVVWAGKLEPTVSGTHKFRLYASSYFKLMLDGKVVTEGWRQNWNAWYHNFNVDMQAGKPVTVRLEWTPHDGHIALLHSDPLPDADRHSLSLASEAAHAIDYYYIAGSNYDDVIAGYRQLTGKAVMLPKWVYGFWQSRQRYKTQDEVLDAVKEYRKRNIPLDNIVQDWFYWREDDWGSHKFDPLRFPDPKGMIDQLHAMNARFMISVWPKFYPTTDNYKELDAKGFIYKRNVELGVKDWVGKGYLNSYYDPYSKEARDIYWRQIRDNLNVLGVDAWWLDATEPDIHSNIDTEELKQRIGPTALGPSTAFFNSYPLLQSKAVYEGDRATDKDTRVFILTRSAFAGQQRHAAATWSGDVASRWEDLRNQISAGVNFSMSGIPNWSFDIGGFALEDRYLKPNANDLAEWRELNLRWFQFGAFVPLFRSHGEAPHREIFNISPEGSEVFNSMVWYDRLRYRLMPYIYTLAADTYHRDGTMLRGLMMDFPNDAQVRNINDQYLFGSALLVNPVHRYQARSRSVYLPNNQSGNARWYDFYSGAIYNGGQRIDVAAPLSRMPLFVRAGAIIPMGPLVQSTAELTDGSLTLNVYTGGDGRFELYEDDGLSYAYERNEFTRIPITYAEATGTLTIGKRQGNYPGMFETRKIKLRFITPGRADVANFDAIDQSIDYRGQAISLKRF